MRLARQDEVAAHAVRRALAGDDAGERDQRRLRRAVAGGARERMQRGASLLDVRSAEEFQQGAFKGSINIPISELRMRLPQLDPVCPYVVYCRNGIQSEVAAFLLRQRGFEVVVLRDGLESLHSG